LALFLFYINDLNALIGFASFLVITGAIVDECVVTQVDDIVWVQQALGPALLHLIFFVLLPLFINLCSTQSIGSFIFKLYLPRHILSLNEFLIFERF